MSEPQTYCAPCANLAEQRKREGKAGGFVLCEWCMARQDAVGGTTQDIDAAKDSAWRAARGLAPEEDRMVASAIIMAAERDVLRRLLCAQLPGGEAEYWALVEQELKR